ncbi:MAG: hypothetical protein GY749_11585 [Desulfobacteraceae bacterium]|nr:hypothetical protein [Desulfobacteraceae bacterium]MCP4352708.1 hypothetical protein [Desulfobacterales bacterium]
MLLEEYLKKLDETIISAPGIKDIQVMRMSVWDTGTEKIALYRYRLTMSDGSLLEMNERLIEEKGILSVTKYRHHWQRRDHQIIKRWDNAPHHPEIKTFPHHLHEGSETNIVKHHEINGLDVLSLVLSQVMEE